MNIVFDIDDTVVDETGFMLKKAPQYLKKQGIKAEIKNLNGYNLAEVFGLKEYFQNQPGLRNEEIIQKCKEIENGFWNHFFCSYIFCRCKKGVRKTINELKKSGINVYFVSCRGKKTKEMPTKFDEFVRLKLVPFLTALQLKRNFIEYNQIKLVSSEDEKIEFINKIHAQFVFDDQIGILQRLPKFSQGIYVKTLHSVREAWDNKIMFLTSFADSRVQEIILRGYNGEKRKKHTYVKWYERKCTEFFYRLSRCLLKNLLTRKIRPMVFGVEEIPADKRAVIYAGNHRNNFDPVILTLYLRRPVHWCALLRLFEAKENLFGRNDIYILRKISALFIKAMGAVPIARPTDDNYREINVSTLLKVDEYIKRGSSIGFFPEGTINRMPEETDLLPIASKAVFQLAARNSCWIQPFSVVWRTNKNIFDKVVIVFTEAIETTGMNVKEIREHWEQAVNRGIKKANDILCTMEVTEST